MAENKRIVIVSVEWVDSASSPGWLIEAEIDSHAHTCHTVGFLISENKECVSVALSRSRPSEEWAPFCDRIAIPRVAIVRMDALGTFGTTEDWTAFQES